MMEQRCPNLIVLVGPNGSGKTTFAAQLLQHTWGIGCTSINADEIANKLGGWNNEESRVGIINSIAEIKS